MDDCLLPAGIPRRARDLQLVIADDGVPARTSNLNGLASEHAMQWRFVVCVGQWDG
jgi:hypothetical protein